MTIAVVGGGAIGGYLAVMLAAAGEPVVLLERRLHEERLAVITLDGRVIDPLAPILRTTLPRALDGARLCLIAVKSSATSTVAEVLAPVLDPATPVVSFQNGLDNLGHLRATFGARALGGVVSFHVLRQAGYRRVASRGKLIAGGRGVPMMQALRGLLAAHHVELSLVDDIEPILQGKLLLNLNNGVSAATGLGIRDVLASEDARRCLAASMREGVAVMRASGMRPARVSLVPPAWMARALTLPGALVRYGALAVTQVDPEARSSTLADLDAGQRTEIDELNGAIVRLAARHGVAAPVNQLLTEIVHEHEVLAVAGRRPQYLAPATLRARIEEVERGVGHPEPLWHGGR